MMTNADMDVDQRLLYVGAEIGRRADRWWMRPLRPWLRAQQNEINACARVTARMRRTIDEIVDEAREEANVAEAEATGAGIAVLGELEHIVATHNKPTTERN